MVGWHQGLNGHGLGQTLEIVRDREDWPGTVLGVTKSWTQLSNCTTTKAWRRYVLLKATQLSCGKAVTGTQVFWHLVQFSFYLKKYLLSAYYVPGTVFSRHRCWSNFREWKIKFPAILGLTVERDRYKQVSNLYVKLWCVFKQETERNKIQVNGLKDGMSFYNRLGRKEITEKMTFSQRPEGIEW